MSIFLFIIIAFVVGSIVLILVAGNSNQNKGSNKRLTSAESPEEVREYYVFENDVRYYARENDFSIAYTDYETNEHSKVRYWFVMKGEKTGILITEKEKDEILGFEYRGHPHKVQLMLKYPPRSTLHIVKEEK